ncbi:DNA mismatch repair endonuclease MutL [Bacillaceae bacterium Marseille-Q3522]|nr:DNA mismatch repair endonuclease MutL [Bacillaceae bacterium Marseille-Q3522]
MGKIIQLNHALSNKIAAGEVVERPASVVKELVENAIDANSSIIEIEVEEAGLAKIRITDNGDGIEEDDILLAFSRHATSKIKNEADLFRIRTLGFRGEALPSIASVARLEMKTSTGEGGSRIVISGGEVEVFEKAASRKGTDITVSDLFFNTPARLKYVKSIHTEAGNISDIVNRLALSHPDISFRLLHNGRNLLQTNGNGDIRQVLAAIYGVNIVKKMVPIEASSLDFTIGGYLSLPEMTRASRNYISTMINGRFIKNYPLAKAIQEGYHTLLPKGRFPIVYLNIVMDPILVDVNVHPAKMEVRFSKEQTLYELVTKSVKKVFQTKELIPSGADQERKRIDKREEQVAMDLDHLPFHDEPFKKETKPFPETVFEENDSVNAFSQEQDETAIMAKSTVLPRTSSPYTEDETGLEHPEEESVEKVQSRIPPMYPIGQMHGTYIFAQNEEGLYIIDQHAAQERIKYEYFKEKVGQTTHELQELLVPLTFEYTNDESLKIVENQAELEKVGIFLEPFGNHSFIVRSHPQWFPKGEEKELIEEIIEQVLQMKKADIKKLREEAAIMMSCKGSIKANRHLRNDEIQALLDKLRFTSDPFTCPHGRPIIIKYSVYELEKMFKRVM